MDKGSRTLVGLLSLMERGSRAFSDLAGAPWIAIRDRLLSMKARLAPALERRRELLSRPGGLPWAAVHDRLLSKAARLGPQTPYLIGLGALTVAAGFPLLHLKLMSGHDSWAYPPRYVEFYQGLKDGQIVPRWARDLAFGHGEPIFNFNPPLLYYLVAGIHALGFGFIQSEDVALLILLALSGLGMYLLANDAFGRRGALVAATAYLFAPYMLVCLYVRHALADYTAFAPIPFAFWGLFAGTTRKSTPHLLVGAIAVAALMLSSVSVAVIVMPALVALVAAVAWRERSARAVLGGCGCIALGLGLSAFFWIPAIREARFVHFSRREEGRFDYHNHFVYIQQLVYSKWGYGLSVPGTGDGFSFGLGPVHLALTATVLLLLRPLWRASARAGLLVASFLVLLLASVFFMTDASLFVWERVSALPHLAFPWRFLSLAAPATALLCGAPFVLLRADTPERRRLANVLMLVAIAAVVIWGFRHAHPQRLLDKTDAEFSTESIATKGIAADFGESEPIYVQQSPRAPAKEPLSVLSGLASVTVTGTSVTEREFFVRVDQDAQLRMNTFYFPGWTLYVDGARQPVRHDPPLGLMDFRLARGAHTVRFEFRDTPVRTWSTRLSLASLAALLLAGAARIDPAARAQALEARWRAVRRRYRR
jgi:hypothetical protein